MSNGRRTRDGCVFVPIQFDSARSEQLDIPRHTSLLALSLVAVVTAVAMRALGVVLLCFTSFACGGATIQHHPVGEIGARAEARVDLVELVVLDPVRAARVRELYLQVAELERSVVKAREAAWMQGVRGGPSPDLAVVATHIESAANQAYHEYSRLMIAVRAQVTEREFARLNAIR